MPLRDPARGRPDGSVHRWESWAKGAMNFRVSAKMRYGCCTLLRVELRPVLLCRSGRTLVVVCQKFAQLFQGFEFIRG